MVTKSINQLSEEDIKTEITNLYFPKAHYSIEKNKVDFAVLNNDGSYLFWAESKKGIYDKWAMIAQLLLTIKPRIDNAEFPPPFIGCFDAKDITFIEFHYAQEVLTTNDFNWNERPSSVSSKTIAKVKRILDGKELTFNWHEDKNAIQELIKKNFVSSDLFGFAKIEGFLQITKNNFVQVFDRWSREVLPSISIPDDILKQGIMPRDFYLADLLSVNNKTISQKLKILLNGDNYEVQLNNDLFNKIRFKDGGIAHQKFWKAYERPPKKEYHKYMLERQDLLVPSGIREIKGAFFTPQQWVELSQKYIADVLGENWQEEYYIWDCCAGTGNLENGLSNPERIWCSTLDDSDVRVMKENKRLLPSHVFQFDFLSGNFSDLPSKLKEIINNPEKQKKLIIYINPPYAEATTASTVSGTGKNKAGVARTTENTYKKEIGKASNELFAQFMARIYDKMPLAKLAQFSKLKYINSSNFIQFRKFFKAKYKGGFVVHANTFDNVKGNFPIGFLIWDMAEKVQIESVECDVIENDGTQIGTKSFYAETDYQSINKWIKKYDTEKESIIGYMGNPSPDFQHSSQLYIGTIPGREHFNYVKINNINLINSSIYFAVRECIEHNWLNDRDQFYYPNEGWKEDINFQNNCLVYTLFHAQNRVQSGLGVNHWIPFTPTEVHATDDFESNFMADFLSERAFSNEAKAVLDAGLELWTYYQSDDNPDLNVNASLYEIREYHRGRADNGRLRARSGDEKFQQLDDKLKEKLSILAKKIAADVYKYGFLKK